MDQQLPPPSAQSARFLRTAHRPWLPHSKSDPNLTFLPSSTSSSPAHHRPFSPADSDGPPEPAPGLQPPSMDRHRSQLPQPSHSSSSSSLSTDVRVNEAMAVQAFQQRVKRFYYQLTIGCGDRTCCHKLCCSSQNCIDILPDAASILAVQLASRRPVRQQLYCPNCPSQPEIDLPMHLFQKPFVSKKSVTAGKVFEPLVSPSATISTTSVQQIPFLYSLFASTPFQSILSGQQQQEALASSAPMKVADSQSMGFWQRAKSVLDLPSLFSAAVSLRQENAKDAFPKQLQEVDIYCTPSPSCDSSPLPSRVMSRSSLSRFGSCDSLDTFADDDYLNQLIDLVFIQNLLNQQSNAPESRESILRLIKRIFSSIEVLSQNFFNMTPNNSSDELQTSFVDHVVLGLDIIGIRKAYQALLHHRLHDQFSDVICSASEILLARLESVIVSLKFEPAVFHSSKTNQAVLGKKLRPLIILLENPLIASPAHYDSILKRFLVVFSKMRKDVKSILARHLAVGYANDESFFQRWVLMVKRVVMERYSINSKVDTPVVYAVRMLSFLYNVNELSAKYRQPTSLPLSTGQSNGLRPCRTIVPFSSFYCTQQQENNQITSINLKEEYPRWLRIIQKPPPQHTREFSLLNYPFLFDPIMKAKILRIESLTRMSAGFENAFVHHAFLLTAKKVVDGLDGVGRIQEELMSPTDEQIIHGPASITVAISDDFGSEQLTSQQDMEQRSAVHSPAHGRSTTDRQRPSRLSITRDRSSVSSQEEVDQPVLARMEKVFHYATNPYLVLEVRRDHLVEDATDQLMDKRNDLHKPLKIKFVSSGEEGLDQGGVQKEFFQLILRQLLDPSVGLFVHEKDVRLNWLNGNSLESTRFFELFGMILGLAAYNGVMVDINLPEVFYKKLLYERPEEVIGKKEWRSPYLAPNANTNDYIILDDLQTLYPSLHRGLVQLLDWDAERDGGPVEDVFCRNFEISYQVYDEVKTFPLVDDGDRIAVTETNRDVYVQLYVKHMLVDSIARPFRAVSMGFWRVVGAMPSSQQKRPAGPTVVAIYMFRPEELQLLLTGIVDSPSTRSSLYSVKTFEELRAGATYEDYTPSSTVIEWFWSIVLQTFTNEQRRKLLWFVTASDRIPLGGLKELTFCVQRNGGDADRLPTALTCFGRLLLPEYRSREKLMEMLSMAIEESEGFGLI